MKVFLDTIYDFVNGKWIREMSEEEAREQQILLTKRPYKPIPHLSDIKYWKGLSEKITNNQCCKVTLYTFNKYWSK